MFKADVLKQLESISPNEPLFCLRAQDTIAPSIVRTWAAKAMIDYGARAAKIDGAQKIAKAMEDWQTTNPQRVKIPD